VINLAEVRAFVRVHAAALGLPPSRTGDLVIAASELAANTDTNVGLILKWGK
jgi:anti-sigma regulatory factor (Ser/Thr protein kinase)